jgi:hypothetical protein
MLRDPCLDPPACDLELLACRAPLDAHHALPVSHPVQLASQQCEAPLHARVKTAAPQQAGLLRGDLKVAFHQPLGQHAIKPLGILLITEDTDPIVGVAA